MRKSYVMTGIACAAVLFSACPVFADDATIRTMAEITRSLNHYPSDADKEKLAAIAESDASSDAEKAVASAITNIAHSVNDADRETLNAIVADENTPDELRSLAAVLVGLNHTPGDAGVAKLDEIIAGLAE